MRGMTVRGLCLVVCVVLLWGGLPAAAPPAAAMPSGFTDTLVLGGLQLPTNVAFSPDGKVYLAEKSGLVKVLDSVDDTSPSTFVDLRTQVHDYLDRGLLGIAVNPDPAAPDSVHVLYSHDAPIGGRAPTYDDRCPRDADGEYACLGSARLSKLPVRADGSAGSEEVLIEDWCGNFPSHSVGTVLFGPDGALYAGGGDGAMPSTDYGQRGAPANGCGDPPQPVGTPLEPPEAEGGSLRAQDLRTAGDPVTLDGTIIRVDPDTGLPWPGNPLASHPDVNARRIIAMGLRNPFRFTFRPGTGEIWVGDVGQFAHEEINRVPEPRAGVVPNFGWPCYEGPVVLSRFSSLDLDLCNGLYAESGADAATPPWFSYAHRDDVVAGEVCERGAGDSVTGGVFYEGGAYPERFHGGYFFGDYARECLWMAPAGDGGLPDPDEVVNFSNTVGGIVDLKTGPGGDLFYVRIGTGERDGELRRIRYLNGGNQPPIAKATADPSSGSLPLEVAFDASGSSDPEGEPLDYAWDLDGDGAYDDATSVRPTRTYTEAGRVVVGLEVTDAAGATTTTSVAITPGASPPTATIASPGTSLRWAVGEEITFSGQATDADGTVLPDSTLTWQVVLHHCIAGNEASDCHQHPLQSFAGVASGSFAAPEHDYPAFLELKLTATAPSGLTDTEVVRLDPRTVELRFATSPPGLAVAAGGDATQTPFTLTAIEGMPITVTAPMQTVEGVTYRFQSWSDGGEATHTIVASEPMTLTAVLRPAGSTPFDGDPLTTERLQGATAQQQALAVSQVRFAANTASHAVLGRDDVFADALAGTALLRDGPMLLLPSEAIPPETLAELDRVLPSGGRIYLLGGQAAISPDVEETLEEAGFGVTRLAGASRVETSVAVAQEILRLNPQARDLAVARGYATVQDPTAAWADSVSAGAWTAQTRSPIVLTQTAELHPAVAAFVARMNPERSVVLGGLEALSAQVQDSLPSPQRIDGANRAGTAALIVEQLWPGLPDRFVVINGYVSDAWAYGLPAAGLAADAGAPLLLSNAAAVPPETLDGAAAPCGQDPRIDVLLAGPTSLLGEEIAEQLEGVDAPPCN